MPCWGRSSPVRALAPVVVLVACAARAEQPPISHGETEAAHPEVQALGLHWTFSGQLVVNANYNSTTMVVGSIPAFVQLKSDSTTGQFNISPGNTFLQVSATPPPLGTVQLSAQYSMDFRSNAPYLNENAFLPLVRDLYLELRWSRLRALVGQTSDVISPRASASLNFYPLSFIPGDIGDYRPQLRLEWRQPVTEIFEVVFQGEVAQAVQTFNVSGTVLATQTGLPDFQGRVGFAFGPPTDNGPRFFETGVAGHVGRRQATVSPHCPNDPARTVCQFASWSFVADGALRVTPSTLVEGEFFFGQLLGDYSGGINQTIDPKTNVPIRSRGGWVQVSQQLGPRWALHAGFGTDDPFDQDLASDERNSNTAVFGNAIFTVVDGLRLGLELSWWRTGWVANPTATAKRLELAVIYAF